MGLERFRSLLTPFFRNVDGIILVYDITRKDSFDEIKNYFKKEIEENSKNNTKIILLGNRTDLEEQWQVPSEVGAVFAKENNYIFMETSCVKKINVAKAF